MCLAVSIFCSEGHVVLCICCLNFEINIVILVLELNVMCEAFDPHVSHAYLLT
jgi:hypothetical protein